MKIKTFLKRLGLNMFSEGVNPDLELDLTKCKTIYKKPFRYIDIRITDNFLIYNDGLVEYNTYGDLFKLLGYVICLKINGDEPFTASHVINAGESLIYSTAIVESPQFSMPLTTDMLQKFEQFCKETPALDTSGKLPIKLKPTRSELLWH